MQANSADHQPLESSNSILGVASGLIESNNRAVDDSIRSTSDPTYFHGYFTSCMEMYAAAILVADYLDSHREWFKRCAHPMKTNPLGDNGYELTVGRFGSFGYEVEPKVGLNLLPEDAGIYRIQTIPLPNESAGYEVDFQASMRLVEADLDPTIYLCEPQDGSISAKMTRIEWELDLKVAVQFPRFIQTLPKSLVQSTGDRLLNQIVRQISRRLTVRVQDDFHTSRNIPFPKKRKKYPWSREQSTAHVDQD